MISKIKHLIVNDESKKEYGGLRNSQYKEVWFLLDDVYRDDYLYRAGSIIAVIDGDEKYISYDEFQKDLTAFGRKEKLMRLNEIRY